MNPNAAIPRPGEAHPAGKASAFAKGPVETDRGGGRDIPLALDGKQED